MADFYVGTGGGFNTAPAALPRTFNSPAVQRPSLDPPPGVLRNFSGVAMTAAQSTRPLSGLIHPPARRGNRAATG